MASASELLKHFGYLAPPVDPLWIAWQLKIPLLETKDPQLIGECIAAGIFLNTEDAGTKQRFDCAHGLGHIFHEHMEQSCRGLFAIQANIFALDLLVPSVWVRTYRRVAPDHTLAEIFGVSQAVISRRLEEWKS